MSTIKQTCACGATLEVTGSGYDVSFRQRDFIKAHEGHDAQPNRMSGGSGAERRDKLIADPQASVRASGGPVATSQTDLSPSSAPSDLRDYLRANLFDGNEDGEHTERTDRLLDRIVENVGSWLAESGGTDAQEIESKKWTFRLDPSGPWLATRLWGSFYDPQGRRLSAAGDKTIEAMLNGLNRAES